MGCFNFLLGGPGDVGKAGLAGFAPVLLGFVATVACSPVKTNDHD